MGMGALEGVSLIVRTLPSANHSNEEKQRFTNKPAARTNANAIKDREEESKKAHCDRGIYGWNPGYQWRWRNRKFGSGNHSWIGEFGMTHRNSITQFSLGFPNVRHWSHHQPQTAVKLNSQLSKNSLQIVYIQPLQYSVSQLACRMSTLPYRSPCRPRLPEFLHGPPIWAGCIPLNAKSNKSNINQKKESRKTPSPHVDGYMTA